MLFKRGKPQDSLPEAPKGPSFAWADAGSEFQQMWVNVSRWKFLVAPSLQAENMLNMDFNFEGVAATGPLRGLRVFASLELCERGKPPAYLSGRWPDHSGDLQGCADAGDRDGYGMALHITLFCQPGAFDWIYRAFSAGIASGSSLGYSVSLDCPTIPSDDFWVEHWLRERLRVRHWSLQSDCDLDVNQSA